MTHEESEIKRLSEEFKELLRRYIVGSNNAHQSVSEMNIKAILNITFDKFIKGGLLDEKGRPEFKIIAPMRLDKCWDKEKQKIVYVEVEDLTSLTIQPTNPAAKHFLMLLQVPTAKPEE